MHEASIDTPAEQICQEMWEQISDGQTSGQTNGRTNRQLQKTQMDKIIFCNNFISFAWICFQLVLEPSTTHQVFIDTPSDQICQEMQEQLADGQTDRQTDGQTDTFIGGSDSQLYKKIPLQNLFFCFDLLSIGLKTFPFVRRFYG